MRRFAGSLIVLLLLGAFALVAGGIPPAGFFCDKRPTHPNCTTTSSSSSTTSSTSTSTTSSTSTTTTVQATTTSDPSSTTTTVPGGQVVVNPGESIQAAVDANPEGTTFVIGAGVHTGQSVRPKSFNVFTGQPGAILDGGTTTPEAFTGGGDNVVIEGLEVRNYASTNGAIKSDGDARNWTVRNNEVHSNHVGIRIHAGWQVLNNHIHSNQRYGMSGGQANVLIEGNEISFNNTGNYNINDDAGGTKFVRSTGLIFRNNNVHDNNGRGFWADIDNIDLLVEGNTVKDNTGAGIVQEIGYDAIIRNNVVVGNGFAQPGWVSGAGILVSNSSNVEIYGNEVRANNDGIGGIATVRGEGAYGPYELKNLYVHDNHIVLTAGQNGIARADILSNDVYTSHNNRFVNNDYESYSETPFRWVDNKNYSWAQWQGFGNDLTGTFTTTTPTTTTTTTTTTSPPPSGSEGHVNLFVYHSSGFDTYTQNPSLSEQQTMRDLYDYMVVFSPYFDSRLSWFPEAYEYTDMYGIKPSHPRYTTNPEWILEDANGTDLYLDYACSGGACPQWAGDVGNPAFRADMIANEFTNAWDLGYPGFHIDDLNMRPSTTDGTGNFVAPIDPRTGAVMALDNWRNYVATFIEEIRAAFPTAVISTNPIWYLDSPGFTDPNIDRQIRASDIFHFERGINDNGLTGGTNRYSVDALFRMVDRIHTQGASVAWRDETATTEQMLNYQLAAYFLTSNGQDSLSTEQWQNIAPETLWAGFLTDIGTADGPRYKWDGLFRRDFTGGSVLLNEPGAVTKTVTVNGQTVTLPAKSGAVIASTTTTTTQPATTTTTQPATASYPGEPAPGKLLWGASTTYQSDPTTRHETITGETLSVYRSFYQWTSNYHTIVDRDIAAGRLPWVSFKTPKWSEVANGQHDARLDQILLGLKAKGVPVWLTVWHEPENDTVDSPANHLAMNRHVRSRMDTLGVNNVALSLILMGWTWDPRSTNAYDGEPRNPDEWWDPQVYDFMGVDPYEPGQVLGPVWDDIKTWAVQNNTDLNVAEWGFTGSDIAAGDRVRAWYEDAVNSNGLIDALVVWDCNQNGYTYELTGEQLKAFHELMQDPRTEN